MRYSNNIFTSSEREEILDAIFMALLVIFAACITYLITFLQSVDPFLKTSAQYALALGFIGLMGITSTIIATSGGYMRIKHFDLSNPNRFFKNIFLQDESISQDYIHVFLTGLIVQVVYSYIYGISAGCEFGIDSSFELNTVLLAINAGIGEEILFSLFLTGFLLSMSPRAVGVFFAWIINLVAFGIVHLVVYQADQEAIVFLLGLRTIYFLAYYKTRRVSIPMLLHCFNNLLFMKIIMTI